MPRPVLVGDTVRRPMRPWTPSVHALLAHLHAHGLAGAVPAPLVEDDRGEEVVSRLPGEVPAYPMPGWVWEAARLDEAARLLRRIHDAAATGFDVRGRTWQLPVHEPAEVVCHNDFAPYNLVFAPGDHRLTGVIDFEAASPGPRAWDLAYLAYRLVPLARPQNPDLPAIDPAVRDARLARLVAAYGAPMTAAEVMRYVAPRLDALAATAPDPSHRVLYAADAAYAREANSASTAY
jgi:Ser/Thr protein kinase RdoA (MazF antagonist)